jgi:hypothetical protein
MGGFRLPGPARRRLGGGAPAPAGDAGAAAPVDRSGETYAALAGYGDDGRGLAVPGDLTRFERRVFSQNGEDGVVAEVLRRVGAPQRWFVEFGAGTGHEGICVALADVLGWSGLFLEVDEYAHSELERKYRGEPRVQTRRAAVTAENVEAIFDGAGVPEEPDVLSIDVDGNDWWIWRALRRHRPRLVVVEYNGNLHPDAELVKPYDPAASWDFTCWFGASLAAYERLADARGYTLVHTDLKGVNAFFLRDDLLAAFGPVASPRRSASYDLRGARMHGDPRTVPWVDVRGRAVDEVDPADPGATGLT